MVYNNYRIKRGKNMFDYTIKDVQNIVEDELNRKITKKAAEQILWYYKEGKISKNIREVIRNYFE